MVNRSIMVKKSFNEHISQTLFNEFDKMINDFIELPLELQTEEELNKIENWLKDNNIHYTIWNVPMNNTKNKES